MKRNRRNRKKININPKYVLVACVAVCLVLVFCSFKFKEKFQPYKAAFCNVITPMQKGIDSIGSAISSKFRVFTDITELMAENEQLKQELNELKSENQVLIQEKYELDWYRELYELDEKYTEYNKVAARVISREPNSYCNEFIIDKGTDDGLKVNNNVIAGNGLVGRIIETGKNWSRVRSIIDDASKVSGMFLKTSDTCIVSGNIELLDKGYIDVNMINQKAEIYDNYEVVTSYISDIYLPGILIGYVSNIREEASSMSKIAYLTPVVDFQHLEAVLVITQLKEELEGLDEVINSDN